MQPRDIKPKEALRRSLGLVWQAAPGELLSLAGLNLISGMGPSVSLWASKVVIDEVSRIVASGQAVTVQSLSQETLLLGSIGAMLTLKLAIEALGNIKALQYAALGDRIQGYLQRRVFEKVATFNDIALFESPELLNLVELTGKGITRMRQLSFVVSSSLTGIFALVPSVLLSATLSPWVPLILIGANGPSTYYEIRHRRKSWKTEETQATLSREMDLYKRMLTEGAYAKELRLFHLPEVFLAAWTQKFDQFFEAMQQIRKEGAIVTSLWALVSEITVSVLYLFIIWGVLQKRYTLGDIALFTGIIMEVQRSVYTLISNIGGLYDAGLATSPVFKLFDLQPELISPERSSDLISHSTPTSPAPSQPLGLTIQDLSFTYPGAAKATLTNLNFQVNPNEMVVLVGENGAGKTTLGKLLCRLYDPTLGSIYWGDRDLRQLDLEELRSRIAVVMQDHARFPASLRENVGWGDLAQLGDDSAIAQQLEAAGLGSLLKRLDRQLETPLGKQLEEGIELSGGQWQRVAIARSMLRLQDAKLLIFDEPTAALDPKNEHEIYDIFREIAKGRMTVIISHRLALARIADRILVLEQGEIIESGHHDELMSQKGRYFEMFSRQASSYI
jgi:ATP-binding cassette, subfamily B, bacterial